jgi:hypothetical protein
MVHISYGADDTGDILKKENRTQFIHECKRAHLYTADGGFDFSGDYHGQEDSIFSLLVAECLIGIQVLQKGGVMIIKCFDTTEKQTLDLLWMVCSLFREWRFMKPRTSRSGNAERYFIGIGFLGEEAGAKEMVDLVESMVPYKKSVPLLQNIYPNKWLQILWDVQETIEKEVTQLGISAAGLKLPLHFEIPQYEFTSHPIQPIYQQKLIEWCGYRSIANQVCNDLLGLAQTPGEIRIWPHHFDTGIYFEPNHKIGIGFGFAMEDSMVGAPYFYISGYPKDRTINYQNTPTSENWKWEVSENWKGCVLPLPKLKDLAENDRNTVIADYLNATYHWFLNQ